MKYTIFTILLLFVAPTAVFSASFELMRPQPPITLGDTIRVFVYIDAKDEPVSIASARIKFPREFLWAKSFTVAPGWLAVPSEEYNFIDNGRGIARATAGFEGGVSGRTPFGTLEFVAVGSGTAEIGIAPDSILLNARNEDILTRADSAVSRINITPPESAPGLPPQLFDIRLELDAQDFSPGEPITMRGIFNSFGATPTPVDMFFTITDESGKIFVTSHENLVVETDAVFTKRFEHSDLPPGTYEMHMNTRYNVNVEDDFRASFRIRRSTGAYYAALGIALLTLMAIIVYGFRSRRKNPRYIRGNLKVNH